MERHKTSLSRRDIEILKMIYQLQAIRTKDIVEVYYEGRPYGYDRLRNLCDKGYIKRSYTVTNTGRQHNSVYSIGERAIDTLYRLGEIEQKRRARDLKLPTMEMLTRIELSKVAIHLAKNGWKILGSIDGKNKQGLQNLSLLESLFISPEQEYYQAYQLQTTMHESTITKLTTELKENKNGSIVLYKADTALSETPAYRELVKLITEENIAIQELCLIPLVEINDNEGRVRNLAIEMLMNGGNKQAEQYLRHRYGQVVHSDNRYGFGNMLVEEGGQEYFVCNYLRRDRAALKLLAKYLTVNEYRGIGKGAIVLTWQGFAGEAQEIIDSYQKREFIKVEGITVRDIIDSQAVAR